LATSDPYREWEACGKPVGQLVTPRPIAALHLQYAKPTTLFGNSMAATRRYTILKYPKIHKESFGIGSFIYSSEYLLRSP
jgi:hypothetical protein